MSLLLRRRALMSQLATAPGVPPPPPVLWDYQNPTSNVYSSEELIESHSDSTPIYSSSYGIIQVDANGTIYLRVSDQSSTYATCAAAIFGPFDLTRCSTVTMMHDRAKNGYYNGDIRLGIWQPYAPNTVTVNRSETPVVSQQVTITNSNSKIIDASFTVDVSSIVGEAYIVPEVYTYLGGRYTGAALWVKKITVS